MQKPSKTALQAKVLFRIPKNSTSQCDSVTPSRLYFNISAISLQNQAGLGGGELTKNWQGVENNKLTSSPKSRRGKGSSERSGLALGPWGHPGEAPLRKGVLAGRLWSKISGLRTSPKVTLFFLGVLEFWLSVLSVGIKWNKQLSEGKLAHSRGFARDFNILLKITSQTAKHHLYMACEASQDFQSRFITL